MTFAIVFSLVAPGTVVTKVFARPTVTTGAQRTGGANDEAVLARLRAVGSHLDRPTNIRFYVYVPNVGDAHGCAKQLIDHGYTAAVLPPLGALPDGSSEKRFSVVAEITEIPSSTFIHGARALFERLVLRYHGEYDGWEAAVQK